MITFEKLQLVKEMIKQLVVYWIISSLYMGYLAHFPVLSPENKKKTILKKFSPKLKKLLSGGNFSSLKNKKNPL